jgi:dihydrolipoamide dehydrogenase
MSATYDVVVIGGGPGGYVCAIKAAQLGKKTLCVEKAELGGICLNWGCIPTKALIKTAEFWDELKHAEKHGITVENPKFDIAKIVQRSRDVSVRLNKGIAFLFKKNKVDHMAGQAVFTSPTTLDVATKDGVQKVTAKNVVIATGARAKSLPGLTPDGKTVITSKEAMIPQKLPAHLLVVGAGAIGIEFAYFYATLGSKVTVVEFQDTILPASDRELSGILTKSLSKRGIEILTGSKLDKIQISATGIKAKVVGAKDGKEVKDVEADLCLSAVGMTGNIEELGLEKIGVKTDRGFIVVDGHLKTSAKGVFAIGDVAGPPLLAHKASFEGHGVAEQIAGHHYTPIDKDQIPACTYCHPQLAQVGLTEEQCKEKKLDYVVGKYPFQSHGMALAAGDNEGLVKLIFGKKHKELLGAHILAGHAGDMIAQLGIALKLETTFDEIMATIHAHPTMSEGVQEAAAQAFGQAVHI